MHSGTAITSATAVTAKVPTMNAQKPNSPRMGDQADEKRRSDSGFKDIIGQDLISSPMAMKTTRAEAKMVAPSITRPASRSFNPRQRLRSIMAVEQPPSSQTFFR
jgi:hypothetical protein